MIQQSILVTVDNVIFTIIDKKLQILLIERIVPPYKWYWALPGGFVLDDESLEQAARRELREETNVQNVYLEQLATFSDPHRDPRGRVITTAYMAICHQVDSVAMAWSDAAKAQYFSIKELPTLAFDHLDIVKSAYKKIRSKLETTNVAQYFLSKFFTITQLQSIYEVILGQHLDVRNFRKKILGLDIIKQSDKKEVWVTHRPAKLYEFINKEIEIKYAI